MKLSYLSYFFTYETHIPDGIGFALFGPWHLLWLSIIFGICVRYVWIYKKGDERKKRRMDGLTACSLVVWIVVRAIYIAVIHEAFLYELPFHLCSMAGILCVVHCLTKWKWLGQVLYTICLPGTVLALLFPNWNFYPVIHFITLEGFLFHMGIVLYVAGKLASHEIQPDFAKLWQVVLFLTAVVIPIYWFDKRYDVNYMFVNWPIRRISACLAGRQDGKSGVSYWLCGTCISVHAFDGCGLSYSCRKEKTKVIFLTHEEAGTGRCHAISACRAEWHLWNLSSWHLCFCNHIFQ